jgi:hypothetical protein
MDTHPAFSTTDCEVNIIDWDRIDGYDWSLKEQILVEVLRFITSDESNVQLEDLLTLTQLEQQAVLVSLNVALTTQSLEENLAHD